MPVTDDQLKVVALHSGVLEVEEDFVDAEFRKKCEEIIPYPEKVEPSNCKDAFLYLKEEFFGKHKWIICLLTSADFLPILILITFSWLLQD